MIVVILLLQSMVMIELVYDYFQFPIYYFIEMKFIFQQQQQKIKHTLFVIGFLGILGDRPLFFDCRCCC